MRNRIALIVLLTLAGCATAPAHRAWKLDLVTAGGIDGKANGRMTVDSRGMVRVKMDNSIARDFHASAHQMWQYSTVLASAEPETWKASYLAEARKPASRELYQPLECCGPVEFHLTMTVDGKEFKTAWLEPQQPLPQDLMNIADQLAATLEYLSVPVTTPRYRQVRRESLY